MTNEKITAGKTRDEIAKAYASEPWWYDLRGFFILTFAYNSTLTSQIRFFAANFGARHLEVACGTGTLLNLILHWRRWNKLPESYITGIDYAESMLAGAVKRFSGQAHIDFKHADAAALPFEDNTFDSANIANSVHCFPDVDGALKDIYRVLKTDGTLAANVLLYPRTIWPFNQIAASINRWGIKKGILFTPYDQTTIREKLVNSGFSIVSESITGNCYNALCRKKS